MPGSQPRLLILGVGRGWAQALYILKAPSQGWESLPLVTPGPATIWSAGPTPTAPVARMHLGCYWLRKLNFQFGNDPTKEICTHTDACVRLRTPMCSRVSKSILGLQGRRRWRGDLTKQITSPGKDSVTASLDLGCYVSLCGSFHLQMTHIYRHPHMVVLMEGHEHRASGSNKKREHAWSGGGGKWGGEEGQELELLDFRGLDGLRESGHNSGQGPVLSLQLLVHLLQGLNLF